MRLRSVGIALFVVLTLALAVTPALAAPSIAFPAIQTYGDQATLTIGGLQPNTAYRLNIYDPAGRVFSNAFTTGATGGYRFPDFGPDANDLPGTVLFEVATTDNTVVARTTVTLTGTSRYFLNKRLGA